ncbi:MAG TPA: nucleoside transporter C-terminal domain-containing protein [Polyangiales bacterium]|nr:nucleoside transporter C-terminal domain-containing protein [Polyangiales bacterium]
MLRGISALGACVLLAIAFACCPRTLRSHVRGRTVLGGLALTLATAIVVLLTPVRWLFVWANDAVERLLTFSQAGAQFVFGPLVDVQSFGFVFAFQVLPTIVFFSALMSLAYHVGLMPWVVRQLGRLLSRALGVSGVESLSTVADIFVGQTEAPLVIKPYLEALTTSELMACMTAGFATTAGGVMAAYVMMLKDLIPGIAGHLIACSVLAAPASLVVAKLMLPEDQASSAADIDQLELPPAASGVLDAITMGTSDGLKLAANVGAMLISFLALTALLDFLLGWVAPGMSLLRILSTVFWPLAWLMGVPGEDVAKLAGLLGQKTVMNEFVAYSTMAKELAQDPHWLSERGRVIASYALCGFANFGSIGIQIGGYAALAPSRRADLGRLAPRAMLGGLLTTCLVACIAGLIT